MSSWRDLERQVEEEKRTARRNERAARRAARSAESERVRNSTLPEMDVVILEFVAAASEVGFPRRVFGGQIVRDPELWEWWKSETEDCRYEIRAGSGLTYDIAMVGTWECSYDFGDDVKKVYGKRAGGYFLIEEYGSPGERELDHLRRVLLATMRDLGIPLP